MTTKAKKKAAGTVISVRTSKETSDRLSRLAEVTHRSKSYLAQQALEQYLKEEEAFVKAVHEGIAAAEAGDLYTDDEVRAKLEAMIGQPLTRS